MNNDVLGVAVVKEVCPSCTKAMDGPIVLNKRLSKSEANKVKKLQGQVIGMSKELCDECKEYAEQGLIIVGVIEDKTEDRNNPYRSGHFSVLKREAVERIFKDALSKHPMIYLKAELGLELGIFRTEEEVTDEA